FSLNGAPVEEETGAQPMRFTYLRLHETAFFRLAGDLYGGVGWAMDAHSDIEDERLDLAEPPFSTSHYIYSAISGFPLDRYSANGMVFRLLYDSRDIAINARQGVYVDAGFRINPTWLGSTRGSSQFLVEFRNYHVLGKGTDR